MENYNKHDIHRDKAGNIAWENYLLNGVLHRLDGPAEISYEHGLGYSECYFLNGKRHRADGPSFIAYHYNENIRTQIYRINDKIHRIDGPALIFYDINGKIYHEQYYILDQLLTKEQFYTPGLIDSFILEHS